MARWYGFNPPFLSPSGELLSRQEDLRLIKNDLLQLLMTVPGERIYRPSFGTPLRATVFDPFTDDILLNLRGSILDAIRTHEPRLTNVQVELEPSRDESTLKVWVSGKLVDDPSLELNLETTIRRAT